MLVHRPVTTIACGGDSQKTQDILMFGPNDDMIPKIADFVVQRIIEQIMSYTARVGTPIYIQA